MKVREIMNKDVITVIEDMDLSRLLSLFREARITGAPVVDRDSKLVGIVSKDDVLYRRQNPERTSTPLDFDQLFKGGFAAVGGGPKQATKVREVMTREVISVRQDTPIGEACRLLWERCIQRLPVVEDNQLVGLVSVQDICRAVAEGRLKP